MNSKSDQIGLRAVLGIDAAWTLHNPSGVALVAETVDGWNLVAAEPSYQHFLAKTDVSLPLETRPTGSRPDAAALLNAAEKLCGRQISVVAIDMPMAKTPIISGRTSDKAVTSAYATRWCSTHQPNAQRPGIISDDLRQQFGKLGFPLLTGGPVERGLVEVYPHPALVELANATKRLEYKANKARKYWPDKTPLERRIMLFAVWRKIAALLEAKIAGVERALLNITPQLSGVELKAYEDTLDAIVCGWIATCVLTGEATPYGDHDSAIWIPSATAAAAK